MKVYQAIANALQARANCIKSSNDEWLDHWTDKLESIQDNILPSGSGIDSGTKIRMPDVIKRDDCIVLDMAYHHMHESGFYTVWTDHEVRVYPDFLNGIRLSISGQNHNDIKDYLYQVFYNVLMEEYQD